MIPFMWLLVATQAGIFIWTPTPFVALMAGITFMSAIVVTALEA